MSSTWFCAAALFCQLAAGEESWRLPVADSAVAEATPNSFFPPPSGDPLVVSPEPVSPDGQFGPEDASDWSEGGGPSVVPRNRFCSAWLAGGGAGGFGNFDLEYGRTWFWGMGGQRPPLAITPGLGVHYWSGPQKLDLPSRVYDLYLDISWRPIDRERGGFAFGITPGIYGDFAHLDGNAFQLTGWGLGNYRFGPHWNLVGGVAVVRQLKSKLLPIGGFVWTPNEETRLEMLIPRPRFARRIRQGEGGEMWCYVAGQFGGGAWSVADTPTDNVLVLYSDLRLILGIEAFNFHGRDITLEAGYVFARDISVHSTSLLRPDPTFLLQASVAF